MQYTLLQSALAENPKRKLDITTTSWSDSVPKSQEQLLVVSTTLDKAERQTLEPLEVEALVKAVDGVHVLASLQCSHILEPEAIFPILAQNTFAKDLFDGLVESICLERSIHDTKFWAGKPRTTVAIDRIQQVQQSTNQGVKLLPSRKVEFDLDIPRRP